MKKSGVIGLVSLLFIIILGLFVWAAGGPAVDIISPANESLIGNNYPSPLLFTTQTSDTVVNDSYTHELWINGTSYGTKDCARETSCAKGPDGTIPEGVNLTWYVNATNGSNVNNTLTYTFSYDTINPFNNISGAYRGNATYFNAGSILAAFYINDTMLANYTLYLYNASSGARLHSYNRTHTTDANKTHNYTVQSWAETLNFSTTFYSGDAMDEDKYVYSLRSYDWYNNYNVSNVTIVLDRTFPLLTYYGWAESNNTVTNGSTHDIVFNVTFTDTYFANATYTLLNTTSRLVLHSTNVTSSASTNVNFSGLPDGNYTFYMNVTDLATNQNITTRWKTVYLNATPLLSFANETLANNTNFSTTSAYLNISLIEYNLVNITFKLTNVSSGLVLNTTIYNATTTNYSSYLMAVNYTSLADGTYKVNATATDTFNHKNTTLYRTFVVDTTVPTSTASRSVASVARTGSLTLSCSAIDNIDASTVVSLEVQAPSGGYVTLATGIGNISSVYSGTSITGTYNVKCTGTDQSGNTAINIATFSAADSSSGSSSSSSGGSSGSSTAPSLAPEDEEVVVADEEEVITKSLETNVDWTETGVTELTGIVGGEVYTFVTAADEESHTINIDSVDEATGTVVVTIQSEPQTITLTLESPVAEVDLNGDLTADMRITLVGITDGEATISVEKIDGLFEEKSSTGLSAWVWVGIIVLVLGISVAIVYFVVKPQKK